MKRKEQLVVVRGGGDIATGTIHKLHRSGYPVVVLETEHPSAIRRKVACSEAIYEGMVEIEGMLCFVAKTPEEIPTILEKGGVPILVDPKGECLPMLKPWALVDGILAKKNLGTHRKMAPITIALGPGFVAGEEVDLVIETMRGHDLGRILTKGMAMKNTGVPGNIGGYDKERVIYAPAQGRVKILRDIGSSVIAGEPIAKILGMEEVVVTATISGLVRGMIREGFYVTEGFKMADIDPRLEEYENCFTISDKARCIAGGVLEGLLWMEEVLDRKDGRNT